MRPQGKTAFARSLRRESTDAERTLWSRLRARQVCGAKFRRNELNGKYLVDFVFIEAALVIEADGGGHFTDEGKAHDEARTEFLKSRGFRVVRFANDEILLKTDHVIQRIADEIDLGPSP